MNVAILDLGSNSFHMIIVDISDLQTISLVDRKVVSNRVGKISANNQRLTDETIEQNSVIVEEFCSYARACGAVYIGAFATGVFRHIKNAKKFFSAIEMRTGIKVEVLTETREMDVLFGVINQFSAYDDFLIIDIGGGSSEFILAQERNLVWQTSIPVGGAVFAAWLESRGEAASMSCMKELYAPVITHLKDNCPAICFGTSGVMRNLMMIFDSHVFDEYGNFSMFRKIKTPDLSKIVAGGVHGQVASLPDEKRDVTYAGALLLYYIIGQLKIDEINVSDLSTREGYLWNLVHEKRIMLK